MKAEYLDHFGDDLMVVNAARVSHDKATAEFRDQDERLIRYLAEFKHKSPFFHPQVQFRITVPIFVANQLKRHQVGLVLNEVSRRYVSDEPGIYGLAPEPDMIWRRKPDKKIKQGSGAVFPAERQEGLNLIYRNAVRAARDAYYELLALGVAPEQARAVLPMSMYTSWIWTGSLYAWANMCHLRRDPHTQGETQQIAVQISGKMSDLFPISWSALMEHMT